MARDGINRRWRTWASVLGGLGLSTTVGCLGYPNPPNAGAGGLVRDPERSFQQAVDSWQMIKEENVVMQKRDFTCGAAALATISQYYWGDKFTETDFLESVIQNLSKKELEERVRNGLSMTDLRHAAVKRGYLASLGRQELAKIPELKIPVIVRIIHDGHEHFVVLRGVVGDRVLLADPIRGNLRMPIYDFSKEWKDRALLVIVKPGVKPPGYSPLLIEQHAPVQPELQAGRRSLFLTPRQRL